MNRAKSICFQYLYKEVSIPTMQPPYSFEMPAHTNRVKNLFSCQPISYTTFSTYDLFSNRLLLSISYSAALFFLLATSGLTFFCPYPIFIIQPSTPPVVRLQM
jgi:hypothetical protein